MIRTGSLLLWRHIQSQQAGHQREAGKAGERHQRDRVGKGDYDIAIGNWSPDLPTRICL